MNTISEEFIINLLEIVTAIADEKSRYNMGQETLSESVLVNELTQDLINKFVFDEN